MTPVILVVADERSWTLRALHLAAALARETGAAVLLLEMVRVAHVEYLGAGVREALLSSERLTELNDYGAAIRAYGVAVSATIYEYTDYLGGLLSAVDQTKPLAVFAPAPGGLLPFVAAARLWYLRRALRRPLYTLGVGDDVALWQSEAAESEPAARPIHSSITLL